MALLQIENLSFTYPQAREKALDGLSLEVRSGDFVLLCGPTGCGKSTLLRLIKKQLAPKGNKEGAIKYDGVEIAALDDRRAAAEIGFVAQDPDRQIVTDKVWHELAFGLESLGEESEEIRRRVAEICGFFGIGASYRRPTCTLSGGQKQLLNLASVMVMHPKVLLLDEPTAQLDPVAASDFIGALRKINDELGVTVILAEHRLEETFAIAHRVAVMDRARITLCDAPRTVGARLREIAPESEIAYALPSAVRIFNALSIEGDCPLTVREGKKMLAENFDDVYRRFTVKDEDDKKREKAIEIKGAFFRYGRELPDVLDGLDLTVYDNEILCVLGGNGAGKSTMLKAACGLIAPYRGTVRVRGKKIKEYKGGSLYRNNVAFLPQNPQALFLKDTLRGDLLETARAAGLSEKDARDKVESLARELQLEDRLALHPYDLSGGEQQKAAFAKILMSRPKIILLDEPTKGVDAYAKRVLADILYRLKERGATIVIVTHDVEFAAEHADRCAMFFDGKIVSACNPVRFFSSNSYYTTAASRISRECYDNAVTVDMVVQLCLKNGPKGGAPTEGGNG